MTRLRPVWENFTAASLIKFLSQMKPLFSKGREKEVYLPGDPRRRDFEEEWLRAGLNLEDQPITVDNGKASKVSLSSI